VAIAGVVVSLIALALLKISRISSILKACVSRCRAFLGTSAEQSTNGFLAINRSLAAYVQTALMAVTQIFITVNALRFFVTRAVTHCWASSSDNASMSRPARCASNVVKTTPATHSSRSKTSGGNITLE
jgi:hypothetical protein